MAEFADIRAQVSIERVFTEMLGVTDFQKSGMRQLLGTCPVCGSKALKITPSLGMSNCFGNKGKCPMSGDIIKAVSRVRQLSITDAGNAIAAHFGIDSTRPVKNGSAPPATFDPVAYQARLDPENEALVPLGISSGTIREFGGGYCAKGKLGDRLALPICANIGGKPVSFFGISLDGTDIKFAREEDRLTIFNTNRLQEGERLTVCQDPITVLRAAENGDPQVVAIFTDYTPDALRRIAAVMEANKIEVADLF